MKGSINVYIASTSKDYKDKVRCQQYLEDFAKKEPIQIFPTEEDLTGLNLDGTPLEQMQQAHLVLFLVSPSFMKVDFKEDEIINTAFERHSKGEVALIPIILEPSDLNGLGAIKYHAFPKNAIPISTYKDQRRVWEDVAAYVLKVIKLIKNKGIQLHKKNNPNLSRGIKKATPPGQLNLLKDLVMHDKTGEALGDLVAFAKDHDPELYSETIFQAGRYHYFKKELNRGWLSERDNQTITKNIDSALLNIIDRLEKNH